MTSQRRTCWILAVLVATTLAITGMLASLDRVGMLAMAGPGATLPASATPGVFSVEHPTDGEHMENSARLLVFNSFPQARKLVISCGDQQLWQGNLSLGTSTADIDTTLLENGTHTLVAELLDESGGALAEDTLEASILNPSVQAAVSTSISTSSLTVEVGGHAGDQVYMVLASSSLASSYFPLFGLALPLNAATTATLAVGSFPPGYSGGPIAFTQQLPSTMTGTCHLALLTFRDGAWSLAGVTTVVW